MGVLFKGDVQGACSVDSCNCNFFGETSVLFERGNRDDILETVVSLRLFGRLRGYGATFPLVLRGSGDPYAKIANPSHEIEN